MSFDELYNRSAEAVALLNDYQSGDLNRLLTAYKNGELKPKESDPKTGTNEDRDGLTEEQRKRLVELLDRADRAVSSVEFPARRLGPSVSGEFHTAPSWGIHFATNRGLHFGRTTVDSETKGTFTATLARYDGKDLFDPVATKEIKVTAGVNRVTLDLTVPGAGEYILVREGDHPLRRVQWGGWELSSRDGLILHGGSKSGDFDKPNDYWYYFFDLSVAVDPEGHLPEPADGRPA